MRLRCQLCKKNASSKIEDENFVLNGIIICTDCVEILVTKKEDEQRDYGDETNRAK